MKEQSMEPAGQGPRPGDAPPMTPEEYREEVRTARERLRSGPNPPEGGRADVPRTTLPGVIVRLRRLTEYAISGPPQGPEGSCV